jgi:hypothetical protein
MVHPTTADKVAEALHDGYQLTDKDQQQLALKDEEYKLQTWEDLELIIGRYSCTDGALNSIDSQQRRTVLKSSNVYPRICSVTSHGPTRPGSNTDPSRHSS